MGVGLFACDVLLYISTEHLFYYFKGFIKVLEPRTACSRDRRSAIAVSGGLGATCDLPVIDRSRLFYADGLAPFGDAVIIRVTSVGSPSPFLLIISKTSEIRANLISVADLDYKTKCSFLHDLVNVSALWSCYLPQHRLYFFELPHGHGSLRPTFDLTLVVGIVD